MLNIFKKPRPDFSKTEVCLTNFIVKQHGREDISTIHAVFPEYPGEMAKKYNWIDDYYEYMILADLEFKRRYPDHDFSKKAWPSLKYSADIILMLSQGKKKLSIKRTKKEVTISIK